MPITLQEQIAIMQAFAEGASNEYKHVTSPEEHWRKSPSPSWNWGDYDYRVAFPVPEYRFAVLYNNIIQAYTRNLSAAEDRYTALVEKHIKAGTATWISNWQPLSGEFLANYKAAIVAKSTTHNS